MVTLERRNVVLQFLQQNVELFDAVEFHACPHEGQLIATM
jgi:hypothetical protein